MVEMIQRLDSLRDRHITEEHQMREEVSKILDIAICADESITSIITRLKLAWANEMLFSLRRSKQLQSVTKMHKRKAKRHEEAKA